MPNKPPKQLPRRHDDAKTLLEERYPQWFFEVEDLVMDDPEEYKYIREFPDYENAKSAQMKFFRFRGSLAHPKNREEWRQKLPNTMALQVSVRGNTLVFQDINLYWDKFQALKEGCEHKARPKQGYWQKINPEVAKELKEVVVRVEKVKTAKEFLESIVTKQPLKHSPGPIHQEPAPPKPVPKSKAEDPEFWRRYPPIFQKIPLAVAQKGEWTVPGTAFTPWQKQWIAVQQEVGEPWSQIELILTDRAAIFKWLPGFDRGEAEPSPAGEPTEE
jgi:hypothetical protein